METQFSLGSADNKGILSLLSAIEQTGDTCDTESDGGGQALSSLGLDITFPTTLAPTATAAQSTCLVCGAADAHQTLLTSGMIAKIESVVGRKMFLSRGSVDQKMACELCVALLNQIQTLEQQLLSCKTDLASKYASANSAPVKRSRSPRKSRPLPSSAGHSSGSLPSVSLREPATHYFDPPDAKMPLQFLANERDSESRGDSRLDVLAQEAELDGGYLKYCSSDEEKSVNATSSIECEYCQKVLKSPSLYQRHIKSHVKDKVYSCEECDKSFSTKHNMLAHMKSHYETRTFSCPHCQREFKGKKSLLEHVSSKHNNEKRFVCPQCPESFASRHLKNVHERTHNGERGFICDQCGESFATVQGLGHHKSKHTGDYQFRCRTCDKGFNNFKLMEEHQHIHTGNKPYQCNKCDKGFANRGSLWIHQKQHVDSKPYACPDCGKGFSHSSHLAVHRRIHTGEKPYRCRLCGEGFISSNHLKRHMKSHAGQLPFACGTCKATFSQRRQLVSHANKVHGGQVVEEAAVVEAVGDEEEGEQGYQGSDEYSLMPVSLMGEEGLGEGENDGRLVDLLGQTIVLIQVPGQGRGDQKEKPSVQF